jgi:hypothetical protein
LAATLAVVQGQTGTTVNLIRSPQRNLVRNSGQYWRALGLLKESRGGITLTRFGREIADGLITKTEFAATVIRTLTLPNRFLQDPSDWDAAALQIRPLELLLRIMARLAQDYGRDQAYLTPAELIRIVIPLAGENAPTTKHVRAIFEFRQRRLDLSTWPDCAPESNDKRMAREFLLFFNHYDFCDLVNGAPREEERYRLKAFDTLQIADLLERPVPDQRLAVAEVIREVDLVTTVERQRVVAEVLVRPGQARFRNGVLRAYHNACLLTGERMRDVLVAAHIKPVQHNGTDDVGNGLCLRADIHILFDSGHVRITPTGEVRTSAAAIRSPSYSNLPQQIELPSFVMREVLEWRWNYY